MSFNFEFVFCADNLENVEDQSQEREYITLCWLYTLKHIIYISDDYPIKYYRQSYCKPIIKSRSQLKFLNNYNVYVHIFKKDDTN